MIVKENDENRKILIEKELVNFKEKTLLTLSRYDKYLKHIEDELKKNELNKKENEQLRQEIVILKKQVEKLKKENEKLNSLKLVKLTRKYWRLRKNILKGAVRKK